MRKTVQGQRRNAGDHQEETVVAAGHDLSKTEAKAATCTEAGNIAYWTCGTCGKIFSDEKGETEISQEETVVAAGHDLSKTEAKAATCTEAGNIEYWTCGTCGKLFKDSRRNNRDHGGRYSSSREGPFS